MLATKRSLLALVGDYPHLTDLLRAFERHCVCQFDVDGNGEPTGDIIGQPCSGCLMLMDPISVRHLQFGRAMVQQYLVEEFREQTPVGVSRFDWVVA